MTCSTCERIRRVFRNGVQKLAPFTEYDDQRGNTYVVARNGAMVGSSNAMHKTMITGTYHKWRDTSNDTYAVIDFTDGQAMGCPIVAKRKVFSNRFA